MLRRLLLLIAALCAPHLLEGQRITGVVRDSASRAPLPGAVVAALDGRGRSLARVITDGAGRYSTPLADSATQLRIVRIGFQPRVLTIGRPHPATLEVAMITVPTQLSTVNVSDDRLCSVRPDRAEALALWEQARAGLLTSIVAREANPAQATVIGYERNIDNNLRRIVRQKARKLVGRTTQPFVAAMTPAALAERGYLTTLNGERTFGAPDADVLLDESFAATHCFSVRRADSAHAGQVGVAFEPVRGRNGIVDVRGTLWLDAGVPALRTIEFGFVGGESADVLGTAAGVIHFRSMPNGVVFVDDWHVRVPIMRQDVTPERAVRVDRGLDTRGMSRGVATTVIKSTDQLLETGGIVQSARWPDGTSFTSPLGPLAGTVVERDTRKPMAGALVAIDATGDTVTTDALGRWAIFPLFRGRYEIAALDTSHSAFVSSRANKLMVEMLPAGTPDVTLELPARAEALKNLCDARRAPGASALLLGRLVDASGTAPVPSDVRVTGVWLDKITQVNRALSFSKDGQAVEADDRGRFSICNVPMEMVAHLVVSRHGIPFADTTIVMEPGADVREVTWRLSLRALGLVATAPGARLEGRVLQSGKGVPLASADVWLPAADRRVIANDDGRFVLDSLPAGRMLVQVRGLGYVVQRDTIRLVAGQVTTRDFALVPLGQVLDTVRTVSDAVKYRSPALRGFEERRANKASGYFITEAELRRQDNSSLGKLITSRVSGLRLVPGSHGGSLLASSSKATAGRALGGGSKPCFVTLYVDGVLVYSVTSDAANDPPNFERFAAADYAGVEFYPRSGTGPPGFNATGGGCGTLLLWTREK